MAVEQTPRVKRTFTTKRKKLEQDLEHVTQEMYRKNLELVETNRTLSLLRAIDTLLLESQDSLNALSSKVAKAIVDNSNFAEVLLFAKLPHGSFLELVGHSAIESIENHPDALTKIKLEANQGWLKSATPTATLHVARPNPSTLHSLGLTAAELESIKHKLPIKTLYFIKLHVRQQLVGLMVVGFTSSMEVVSQHDQALLGRLSEAVGVALDSKLLFDENQRVLSQLQKTNDKLRQMDETKDDFISMASHQLRTPLTSVKGYVSMVLDNDAGKITAQQRKLLDQAFTSSQRMVYLIADLLNVSRLKTGKFIIDNHPTNLSDVVESELSQLTETAKGRGLKLVYEKPKNFPELELDETKIRQVIMNFADNAIYYTPDGGTITVALEDKPKSVEFTVSDNGIGVPKALQHHLFTKFYRADNAKKARPDGTGLGLFMAKKVIAAQGGALIFHSEEGKGSTFGFSFPKAKGATGKEHPPGEDHSTHHEETHIKDQAEPAKEVSKPEAKPPAKPHTKKAA